MKSNQSRDWAVEIIIAANEQLEYLYFQHGSACLALQISRNYRLLLDQDPHPLQQQVWQSLSQRWWLRYQLYRGRQQSTDLIEKILQGESSNDPFTLSS